MVKICSVLRVAQGRFGYVVVAGEAQASVREVVRRLVMILGPDLVGIRESSSRSTTSLATRRGTVRPSSLADRSWSRAL
jgi:hypothetical protein